VFFAWEYSIGGGTDFLILGLDTDWLLAHPDQMQWKTTEYFDRVRADGGMVIQAHPYREAWYIEEIRLFPDSIDGVEIYNASHYGKKEREDGRSMYDIQAMEYAIKYNLPVTGGSDIHSTDLRWGGMAFREKLDSVQDYMKAVLRREGQPIDYFTIRRKKDGNTDN
jgi:hypothetical protein